MSATGDEVAVSRSEVLTNDPLFPLIKRAEQLSQRAGEIWIASGFVSESLVASFVPLLATKKTKLRLLTGTYSNFNRKKLFTRLLSLAEQGLLEARVWHGDGSSQFHAKLFIWRRPAGKEVWIGSANFTNGGLNNEGEIVLALRGAPNDEQIRQLERAFERSWSHGVPIDANFVASYRQAEFAPSDARIRRRRSVGAAHPRGTAPQVLVRTVGGSCRQDTVREIEFRLGPSNELAWGLSRSAAARSLRPNDLVCCFNPDEEQLDTYRVHSTVPYGRGTVILYLGRRAVSRRVWSEKARKILLKAGIDIEGLSPSTKMIEGPAAKKFVSAIRRLPHR
jgi:HKD family nuclease